MKKRINALVWFLAGLSFILGASIAFRNQTALIRFFNVDDAFYYFQVAKNATSGGGLSFDGIARGNGYHPLWMLICLPVFSLSTVNLWLPLRILVIIQAILHAATGVFIYKLLVRHCSQKIALVSEAIWLFSIAVFQRSGSTGLETGINLFCISLFILYLTIWIQKKADKYPARLKSDFLLGILASFVLLARLDNIFLICFVGLWITLEKTNINRRLVLFDLVSSAASVILGYLVYLGFSHEYYQLMPQIKLILIVSMIVFPLFQFLIGSYQQNNVIKMKLRDKLFQFLFAIFLASLILFAIIQVIIPEGNYSRIALILQIILTTIILLLPRVTALKKSDHLLTQEKRSKVKWPSIIKVLVNTPVKTIFLQGITYFGPVFLVLGGYLTFNKLYFDTTMPLSGKIKAWWGLLSTVYGRPASNLIEFLGFHSKGPWNLLIKPIKEFSVTLANLISISSNIVFYLLILGIFVLIFSFVLRNEELKKLVKMYYFLPISVGILFHVANYLMTGYVGYRSWYWTIEIFYILFLSAIILYSVVKVKKEDRIPNIALSVISGLFIIFLIGQFVNFNINRFPFGPTGPSPDLVNTTLLDKCTEKGSLIGMTGGGMEAYFLQDRTIVNLDGLINGVDYYHYLTTMSLDDYLENIGVDYLFGKEEMLLRSDPYMQPLSGRLTKIVTACNFEDSMVLYRFE